MKSLRAFEILEYLKTRKRCTMAELLKRFDVSSATMHRDVAALARENLVRKVHGGVEIPAAEAKLAASATGTHFSARINRNTGAKETIACLAAGRIGEGDIVFLDSSTTSLFLARELQKSRHSNLTIITNSVLVIQEFHLFPSTFVLISLGGNYNCQLHSFLGRSALGMLKSLKIGKAFISAFGITAEKVTTYHEDHAEFLAQVVALAAETYLLIDSSKFGQEGLFAICSPGDVACLVSESAPPAALAKTARHVLSRQDKASAPLRR